MFHQEKLLFEPAQPLAGASNVVFAFPNEYAVGIVSLGYQVVWRLLKSRPDLRVARLFTDAQETLPNDLDLVGFSFSWELDFTNIFNLLEGLKLPLRADQRTDEQPLIFGGGPVLTANPEPLADFFDVILLGDGEELIHEFITAYREVSTADRLTKLQRLSQVPGIYIPSLYRITYHSPTEGLAQITPIRENVPPTIQKRTWRGTTLSSSSVVTPKCVWENIYMVEVVRSCPELCRFCLASYLTLPFRTPTLSDSLIPLIEAGLKVTPRLGLLGASVSQHPEFDSLLDYLEQDRFDGIQVSVSSVRASTLTEKMCRILAKRGTNSVTIAVESGSERLRQVINKKLTNEQIHQAAHVAQIGGLKGVKLYGMAGLPSEETTDLEATVAMLAALRKAHRGLRLSFGCSTFVPKAHTPFQVYGVDPGAEKKLKFLEKQLPKYGIDFRPESYSWSVMQALISRGDRRVGQVLLRVHELGSSLGSFRRVFKELKGTLPPLDWYVHADWSAETVLPWQHLLGPVSEELLNRHLEQARSVM